MRKPAFLQPRILKQAIISALTSGRGAARDEREPAAA